MAYDEYLGERIAHVLIDRKADYRTIKMMGGLCFMVDDKMCVGIINDMLMCRIGPDGHEEALTMDHVQAMGGSVRPMKGYVFVEADGYDMDEDMEYWIDRALQYNPQAKSSKKKKVK